MSLTIKIVTTPGNLAEVKELPTVGPSSIHLSSSEEPMKPSKKIIFILFCFTACSIKFQVKVIKISCILLLNLNM